MAQSGWGFTAKQDVTTVHEDSAAYAVRLSLQLDNGGGRVTHASLLKATLEASERCGGWHCYGLSRCRRLLS